MKTILLILTLAAGTALRAGEGIIHGRVFGLDQNGALAAIVSGAKVELQNESGATISSATSNSDGLYELTGLDAGDYRYRVTAAGYRTEDEKRGFSVTDAGRDYVHDFLLWKDGAKDPGPAPAPPVVVETRKPIVHGRVFRLDAEGKLVGVLPGAKVELLSAGKLTASTTAQDSGYYIIRDVAPGDYQYRVTAAGVEPEDKGRGFTVPTDTLEYVQDFLLGPPPPKRDRCDLAILVVKRISSGKDRSNDARLPVANAKLVLQPKSKQPIPLNQPFVTDVRGEYLAKLLGEGDYTVAIDAPECEPFTGPLTVKCEKDGDVIFELQPCNELLHGYLRAMASDGWGKSTQAKAAAERAYQRALKADSSGDCGVNYVRALTQISAEDYKGAQESLAAAIGKKTESEVWDLACGMYLYMNLVMHQPEQAVRSTRSLVANHYATRAAGDAAQETAYICGVVLGMAKGPWQDLVGAGEAAVLESELLSGLKGELRTALVDARDHVAEEYAKAKAVEEKERGRLLTEAIEKRNADIAAMEQRQDAIQKDVAAIDAELQRLDAVIASSEQLRINAAGFMQQRQLLGVQIQPLNARLQEITNCMAEDQREAALNPNEATQIFAEIQQHQIEIGQIRQKIGFLQNQDAQLAAKAANLQNQYQREAGTAVASHRTKMGQREAKVREFDKLEADRMRPFDPDRFTTPELEQLGDACRMVKPYHQPDLEEHRKMILDGFDCGAAKDPKRLPVTATPVQIVEQPFRVKMPVGNRAMPAQTNSPRVMPVLPSNTPSDAPMPTVKTPLPASATAARPPPNTGDPAEVVVTNNHTGAVRIFGISPGAENEQFVRSMQSGDEAMIPARIGQLLIIKATTGGRELQRHKVGKKLEVLKIGGTPQ